VETFYMSEGFRPLGILALAGATAAAVYYALVSKPGFQRRNSMYKLYYWNGRGRAQLTRYILAEAGVDWTDVREPEDHMIASMKAEGVLPYDQWPVLDVDGKILAQSNSIARFVAKRFGIYGSSAMHEAEADGVVDAVYDLSNDYSEFQWSSGVDKEEKRHKFISETLPKWLATFERNLGDRSTIVGDEFTYADLALMSFIDEMKIAFPNCMGLFPRLQAHWVRMQSRPNIQKWLQNKPPDAF